MIEKNTTPCRKMFTDTLLERARADRDIIVVTSDARGSVTLNEFADALPKQFVEVGIAEQNAVGIGAGLAAVGKKVFVCGPACFYVARSLEQVKVDVAYSGFPVKILGVSGGMSYGALGATHHSLHDMAVLRTFPGMHVFLPSDIYQTRALAEALIDYPYPVYVRVGRNAVPNIYTAGDTDFTIGKARMLQDGRDLTLIGTGETVFHCLQAGKRLQAKGVSVRVLDLFSIKPFDREAVEAAARETGRIMTVEEHSMFGGLGAAVAEVVAQTCPVPMKIVGIPDENVVNGTPPELFRHYGLEEEGICREAVRFMDNYPVY
jgi:transketolase